MFTKGQKKASPRKPMPSKAKAIRNKCKDCIYDTCSPGSWLQQVTACDSKDCALWEVRPKTRVSAQENI